MNRPLGVTIVVVLCLLGGLWLLVTAFLPGMARMAELMHVSVMSLRLPLAICGVLGLTAGLYMWTGSRMGWWAGCIVLAFVALYSLNGVFSGFKAGHAAQMGNGAIAWHLGRNALRGIVACGFYFYLFSQPVEGFFGLNPKTAGRRMAFSLAGALVLWFVLASITRGMG